VWAGVVVVTLVDALLHVLYLGVISRLAKQALLLQHLCRGGGEERKREERRGEGLEGLGHRGGVEREREREREGERGRKEGV
jgi:hypothetical protein